MVAEHNYADQETINGFFDEIEKYKDIPELREYFLLDVLDTFGMSACRMHDIKKAEVADNYSVKPLSYMIEFNGYSKETWAKELTPYLQALRDFHDDMGFKDKRKMLKLFRKVKPSR